jgi:hypothetical protein
MEDHDRRPIGYTELAVNQAITTAARIDGAFNISRRFGLGSDQTSLFHLYLTGGLIQKMGIDALGSASIPAPLKTTLPVTNIPSLENAPANKNPETIFFSMGDKVAKQAEETATRAAYKHLSEVGGIPADEIIALMSPSHPMIQDLVQTSLDFIGSPVAIRRAAMTVADCYIEVMDISPEDMYRRMNEKLAAIRIKREQGS